MATKLRYTSLEEEKNLKQNFEFFEKRILFIFFLKGTMVQAD